MKKIVVLFFILISSMFAESKHVLLINSYHQSMDWVRLINDVVQEELQPKYNNIILHIENMDTKRIYNENYLDTLRDIYSQKYKNKKIDLIMTSDDNAFNFVKKNRQELFGNVPTIFSGLNNFKETDLEYFDNSTGVVEVIDSKSNIDTILKLYPNTKEILIVNDFTVSGNATKEKIKEQIGDIDFGVKIRFTENRTLESINNELKNLPRDTIILLGAYFRDSEGKSFITYENMGKKLIEGVKNPIFALYRFNVHGGVIGGKVLGSYSQGLAMVNMAKLVLKGVKTSEIPVNTNGTTRYVFDYIELQKQDISLDKIPKESIVLNKPVSYYDKHKNIILVSIITTSLLCLVILFLIKNINQRKKLEKNLKELNENLEQKIIIEVEKNRKKEKQLYEQSKLAQMGEMIANISHQWRQPLSMISTAASGIRVEKEFGILSDKDLDSKLEAIVDKTEYLSRTLENFRNFINESNKSEEFILQEKIDNTISIVKDSFLSHDIKITTQFYKKDLKVLGKAGELSQVMLNILNNARDAIITNSKDKENWIQVEVHKIKEHVLITFEDNGKGIEESILDKVFDVYFTTKHQSQGTGLGLYMSHEIITKHFGGKLYVTNTRFGAKFCIELPVSLEEKEEV